MKKSNDAKGSLIELIRYYPYFVTYDAGDGLEVYDGCEMNLLYIIEDCDTTVKQTQKPTDDNPHSLWEAYCPSMRATLFFNFTVEE